jgi:MFS family permease
LKPLVRPFSAWALVGVGLPFGALVADFMAVSVALPTLQHSTGASFSELIWVLEAYLLSLGTSLLASSFALARFGQARSFQAGSAALAAGAALAGAAPSVALLILARALEGAGAGLVLSAGPLLLAGAYGRGSSRGSLPLRTASPAGPSARGQRVVGLAWQGFTALSVAAAPVAGGAVTAELGWRYLFYLEAAMGAAGTVTFALLGQSRAGLARPARSEAPPPDWAGLGLLAGAVALGVIGLLRTTYNLEAWASSGVIACLCCSGLLLVAFVGKETVAMVPALPVALFGRRSVAGASSAALGLSVAAMAPLPLLALYLGRQLGYGPLAMGVRLLVLSAMSLAGVAVGALASKWVPEGQTSSRWLLPGGLGLVGCGLWLLSLGGPAGGWAALWPGLVVVGAGYEMASARLAGAAAAGLPLEQAPVAAKAVSVVRQFGTALGLALFAFLFAARLTSSISNQLGPAARLSGEPPALAGLVLKGDPLQAARQAGTGALNRAFTAGLHELWTAGALVAAACALVTLLASTRSSVPAKATEGAATALGMVEAKGASPAGAFSAASCQDTSPPRQ